MSLYDVLRAPAVAAPGRSGSNSLHPKKWRPLLGRCSRPPISMAGEVLHEEDLAIWMQFNPLSAERQAAGQPLGRRSSGSATAQGERAAAMAAI